MYTFLFLSQAPVSESPANWCRGFGACAPVSLRCAFESFLMTLCSWLHPSVAAFLWLVDYYCISATADDTAVAINAALQIHRSEFTIRGLWATPDVMATSSPGSLWRRSVSGNSCESGASCGGLMANLEGSKGSRRGREGRLRRMRKKFGSAKKRRSSVQISRLVWKGVPGIETAPLNDSWGSVEMVAI